MERESGEGGGLGQHRLTYQQQDVIIKNLEISPLEVAVRMNFTLTR